MWLAGDGVTQWNIHEGENKYPNELPCPRGIAPLCTISNLSHMGWGEIWLILYWIIFLHSFISTGRTDKLFDHKALLSAKSHFRVVMANDLASWLRESQVVSMCLKLATPRTSGGLNKTPCIKVRKMKRRSLHRTYRTFNDTVRRYHQCQWNIYAATKAPHWCPNFFLTQSPLTSFLSSQMLMQRRNSKKTTKARNHFFFVFFIYIHLFYTSTLAPQVLAQSSCKLIHCDTGPCSTSS